MPLIKATSVAIPRFDILGAIEAGEGGPSLQGRLAPVLFPPLPVDGDNGSVGVISPKTLLSRGGTIPRAPGSPYAQHISRLTSKNFLCKDWGNEEKIDDGEAAKYANILDYDVFAYQRMQRLTEVEEEIRVRDLIHDAAVMTGSTNVLNVSNNWTNAANGTPIADIEVGVTQIRGKGGLFGVLVLQTSWRVRRAIGRTNEVREALKYSGPVHAVIPDDELADVIGVDRIAAAPKNGVYDQNPDGAAVSIADIWVDQSASLVVVPVNPNDKQAMCAGRTFHNPKDGGLMFAEQYRDEKARSDMMRARQKVDNNRLFTECMFRFTNVAA